MFCIYTVKEVTGHTSKSEKILFKVWKVFLIKTMASQKILQGCQARMETLPTQNG